MELIRSDALVLVFTNAPVSTGNLNLIDRKHTKCNGKQAELLTSAGATAATFRHLRNPTSFAK